MGRRSTSVQPDAAYTMDYSQQQAGRQAVQLLPTPALLLWPLPAPAHRLHARDRFDHGGLAVRHVANGACRER